MSTDASDPAVAALENSTFAQNLEKAPFPGGDGTDSALDVAPPFVFRGRKEVAIDLLHHTVYAIATGIAHELVAAGRRNGSGPA